MSSAGELPPPPWSAARRRRARAKPALTQQAIVDAALELLDAEGLEAVTMRRVAQRLDTGPASFYQHIGGKEELLELLFDRVAGEIEAPAPDPTGERWQESLKQLMRSTRETFNRHRDIAHVTLGRIPTGPNVLALAEAMLAILDAGDVPPDVSTYAVDMLALFIGAVSYEDAIRASQFGGPDSEYFDAVQDYFAALPAERYPTLARLSDWLIRPEEKEDDRFEFALDVQVRGIAALAGARRAASDD